MATMKPRRAGPAAPLRCLQLSLFDAPAEESETRWGPPLLVPPALDGETARPTAPQRGSAPLPPRVVAEPELTPGADASALVAPFAHPLADARIELNGRAVAYALRRAQRRSIGLQVGADGLRVSAPRWATRRDIMTALNDKADWIVRKLEAQAARALRLQAAQVAWESGATLPYQGEPLQIRLAQPATLWQPQACPPTLCLGLPGSARPPEVQAAVVGWLKQQALALFTERCRHFAPLLQVNHTRLCLSSAQTRWGSAHASGVIRLNWRLIHFSLPVIDYVVAHELAHLREMNHSPRFWALVASVIPDVAAAQQVLRDTVLPAWQ